jgi:hypothetical protein
MRGLFLGMDLKYLTRRIVMVPLLQEFFFVRDRVSFDQILKLREVRRAQESPYHGEQRRRRTKGDQHPGRSAAIGVKTILILEKSQNKSNSWPEVITELCVQPMAGK